MNIRFGIYTLYIGLEMTVTEYYGHGLDQDFEQNHRIISYPVEFGCKEGFKLDKENNVYRKDILLKDLKNAFFIKTKVIFHSDIYDLWAFNNVTQKFTIYTTNDELGQKNNFLKLSDRFIREINFSDVKKLWEEYLPSSLNLPMPEGLPKKRVLEIEDIL